MSLLLPQPENKQTLNFADGTNADIILTVHNNFPKAVEQTKEFAKRFKGSSARETAHNVWKFLKEHITYTKDDTDKQLIRLPSRFIHDGKGDCKSYSLAAAALLANNGLPVRFRYASYNILNHIPSHVYTVTEDENGKDIIVDGVWRFFNSEKKPTYKFDKAMKVYTLSGFNEANDIGGKKKKKGFLKKIGKGLKKFGAAKKKIALAPSRRAFRTLVSINAFGLARKIKITNDKNPNQVASKWKKLGGDTKALLKSVKKGYNHYAKKKKLAPMKGHTINAPERAIIHREAVALFRRWQRDFIKHRGKRLNTKRIIRGLHGFDGGDIGAAPLAAALAAAAPIIAALAPLFKKSGADKEVEAGESSTGELLEKSQEAVQAFQGGGGGGGGRGGSGDDSSPDVSAEDPTDPKNADKFDKEENEDDEPKTGFKLSPKILLGGAALIGGGLYLMKKKK